jgi:hypothetical protein
LVEKIKSKAMVGREKKSHVSRGKKEIVVE